MTSTSHGPNDLLAEVRSAVSDGRTSPSDREDLERRDPAVFQAATRLAREHPQKFELKLAELTGRKDVFEW